MSDQEVIRALEAMERMLAEGDLAAEVVGAWVERFEAAKAGAARGPAWAAIVDRCHELGKRVDSSAAGVAAELGAIEHELALQAKGARALRAYKPS